MRTPSSKEGVFVVYYTLNYEIQSKFQIQNHKSQINAKFWQAQGAQILYLSLHETTEDVEKDKSVLDKYGFPKGQIFYRRI